MSEETVTITKKEYDELLHDSKVLNALECGGVDNWQWYEESMKELWAEEEAKEASK